MRWDGPAWPTCVFHASLGTGAQHDTIELEREQKDTALREKRYDRARHVDPRRLDGLDADSIERVTRIEVASGGDPSEAFEAAFVRRLREKRLPLICLTIVMTHEGLPEGWRPIQQAIVDQLAAKQPEDAVSLLTMASATAEWKPTTYTVTHEGPDHARTFTAEAALLWDRSLPPVPPETVVGVGKGSTAKLAKQHASIALLAKLVGAKSPESVTKVVPGKAPPPKPNGKFVYDATKDPVSALMEYVAKTKTGEPVWEFAKSGPDHIPTLTCTCKLGPHMGTGTASSKQDAKKQAAKAVLEAALRA